MSLTTAGANLQLTWTLTATSVTRPTAWYIALHTANPTETGTVGELTTSQASSYARYTITFGAPSASLITSSNSISIPVGTVTGTVTVTHVSIWKSSSSTSADDVFYYGALAVPRLISSSETLVFAPGEITIRQD
jgi:hypothetical protein